MRKEVITALILGILLGGVILYGIKIANQAATIPDKNTVERKLSSPSPTPQTIANTTTNIVTPKDHSVAFESVIPVKGSGKPNTTVIIASEEDEKIITLGPDGVIDTTIELSGGENNLLFSTFVSDTLIASSSIQVIYSTSVIQ